MTIEQIRGLYEAQQFEPFTMHLADGRALSVPHREFLAMSPAGRTVVVYRPDGIAHIVDLLLVTDLEMASGEGQNGHT